MSEPSADWTLREFYDGYITPFCLAEATDRTLEAYEQTLKHWETFTDNPPLKKTTIQTLSDFQTGVKGLPGKRSEKVSQNTVRKHHRHLMRLLDLAGPPGRRCRDAAGLLAKVPWIRPPREVLKQPVPADVDAFIATYLAADQAVFPLLDGVSAPAWWRAILTLCASTSLRRSQLLKLPSDSADYAGSRLIVPAEISRKSLREQILPLHSLALKNLVAIRGDRSLLLPFPHSINTLYKQLYDLQAAAAVPLRSRFAFHDIRRLAITEVDMASAHASQLMAGHASYKTTVNSYLGLGKLESAVRNLPLLERLADAG